MQETLEFFSFESTFVNRIKRKERRCCTQIVPNQILTPNPFGISAYFKRFLDCSSTLYYRLCKGLRQGGKILETSKALVQLNFSETQER
jgi:hypothetical protein